MQIADRLGMASSPVHAVLVRCRRNRLSHIDRATGEPIRRYEHEKPGDLIHQGSATEVLKNAVAWFADRGVTVHRVLSDNGSCY